MITLYLARHGQTEQNLAHIFQGQMPGNLTALGRQQAAELGERLRAIPFDSLLSSDLARAYNTVEIACGDRHLPHYTTPLLREIDWGSWTGLDITPERSLLMRPADAESDAQLYERAARFVDYVRSHFEGQTLFAVGHGMINRRVIAQIEGLPLERVKEVPLFTNCEYRRLTL